MTGRDEIICILCPLACRVSIRADEQGRIVDLAGFQCRRGKEYAEAEHRLPVRFLTTTLRVQKGPRRLLPVRTSRPLLKSRLRECMNHLARIRVTPPIKGGDVIVSDILGTGVDVIATGDLGKMD
jgi:CxxC motif-containing protein